MTYIGVSCRECGANCIAGEGCPDCHPRTPREVNPYEGGKCPYIEAMGEEEYHRQQEEHAREMGEEGYLGILPEEDTPLIIEVQQVRCSGFANKARGQFRMAQGPRYVWAHIFTTDAWIHPSHFSSILTDLISGGHSFEVRTIRHEVSMVEYEGYREFETGN